MTTTAALSKVCSLHDERTPVQTFSMAILLLSMLRSDVHEADDKRLDAGHCDDRAAVTASDKNARVFLKV
jgi:hypothetical protein